ncbi:MAG: response regulator [Cyanothece sp. SIO1E1]|nr:response regulator [Cyanothece sp. SIO1E1]
MTNSVNLPTDHDVMFDSGAIPDNSAEVQATPSPQSTTLSLSEKRFFKAFQFSPNPIVIATLPDGTIADANDSFLRFLGYEREQIIGHPTTDLNIWVNPQDRVRMLRTVQKEGRVHNQEFEFRIKSGETRTVLLSVDKIDLDDQACLIGTINDITLRKKAEDSLKLIFEGTASTTGCEFFRACVRYLAQVLQVRYAMVSEFKNEAKTRVRTLAFWTGETWSENIEYDLAGTPCDQVLKGNVSCHPKDVQLRFPEDQDLSDLGVQSYLGMPLVDVMGDVLGHLAVMGEVPMTPDLDRELILKVFAARAGAELERKLAESALQRAKVAADAANRAKSEFLASMSHELRTPLNAILGFAQMMSRDTTLGETHHQHLGIINRSGEHLLSLVNDILEMSRIEAGRTVLNENSFDLIRLLDSLEDMLRLRAEAKGLQLLFEKKPDIPQYVKTDEGKLRQVLINLLGNAIKFTQEGGVTLRVGIKGSQLHPSTQNRKSKTQNAAGYLHFEIEDTGPGITEAEIDKLFAAFGQTATGRKSQEGTGLGLPISRKFVQLMGGDIDVNSVPGQGSVFAFDVQIRLAQVNEVETHTQTRRVIGLAPDQPNYRILVVEDRLENRLLLVKLLTSVGFQVREASDGGEAVALWESWEPHLIWMDMRMPILDGYETTKRIRSHLKGQATVIIALTASAFEEERVIVLSAGCDDFVRKPFREQVIFDKLTQYLGVKYVYDESPQQSSPDRQDLKASSPELSAASLRIMPPEWIAQLHQAAISGDDAVVSELITAIPGSQAAIAATLTELVDNFRLDVISDLTDTSL